MKRKLFFLTAIISIVIIIFGSCNGASTKSTSDTGNNNTENESDEAVAFTIVPVIKDQGLYPLRDIVELWYTPQFAFKDKYGQYLRFDNDGEYSDLCYLPFLVRGFLKDDMTYDHTKLKRASVMNELYDSFNIPVESTIIGHWGKLDKFDTEEIRIAINTHYKPRIAEAFNMISNDFILYLTGNKDKMDPEVLIEIERFIYDNHHPEYSSIYQVHSSYNLQCYKIDVKRYWNGTDVFPVIDKSFTTLMGDTIPKGSLIMGYRNKGL